MATNQISSYKPFPSDLPPPDPCCICLEDDKSNTNSELVGHTSPKPGEILHPVHISCLKPWLESGQKFCPTCRAPINDHTLYTRKERYIRELAFILQDALQAVSSASKLFLITSIFNSIFNLGLQNQVEIISLMNTFYSAKGSRIVTHVLTTTVRRFVIAYLHANTPTTSVLIPSIIAIATSRIVNGVLDRHWFH